MNSVNQSDIWIKEEGKYFNIGLTEECLSRIRENIWAIFIGKGSVNKDSPLFTIETSDELITFNSPIGGTVIDISSVALDNPDELTGTTILLSMRKLAAHTDSVELSARS